MKPVFISVANLVAVVVPDRYCRPFSSWDKVPQKAPVSPSLLSFLLILVKLILGDLEICSLLAAVKIPLYIFIVIREILNGTALN